MQESRELHTAMDSRIRGNDGDGFVTKAQKTLYFFWYFWGLGSTWTPGFTRISSTAFISLFRLSAIYMPHKKFAWTNNLMSVFH
jgi:hypothetical protein